MGAGTLTGVTSGIPSIDAAILEGRWQDAEKLLVAALRRGGTVRLHRSMADVQRALARPDRVAFELGRAWAVAGKPADLTKEYLLALSNIGDMKTAAKVAFEAAGVTPQDDELQYIAAESCAFVRRFRDAERLLRPLAQRPDATAWIRAEHMRRVLNCGDAAGCVALGRAAAERFPAEIGIATLTAFAMNYLPDVSPAEVVSAHRRYAAAVHSRSVGGWVDPMDRWTFGARPLRVGLLGAEFRAGPVARFTTRVFESIDRGVIDLRCYYTAAAEDDVTQRFRRRASIFRQVDPRNAVEAARVVRADRCDVLLDLAGLSGGSIPTAVAGRLAPVQIGGIGYPNCWAMNTIDGRIVDARTDPEQEIGNSIEPLIRMPNCFLCFEPPSERPSGQCPSDRPPGHVTFGSYNTLAKISDRTLTLWSRVLKAVPRSRLVVKNLGLADEMVRREFIERAGSLGIDPARLTARGYVDSLASHILAYEQIDIGLDTFPYHGTTTTCEALSMGVPVVVLAGDVHAARVGVSLLTAAGVPEWIARDEEQYVEIASRLANDAEQRRRLRSELRTRLEASDLCDAIRYAGELQSMMQAVAGSDGLRAATR